MHMMKSIATSLLLSALATCCHMEFSHADESRPNVLMIAIDDLNDWVEPLEGHPQTKTPAMKQLAGQGVNFTNAHCQSPLCNSSRTSLMMSLRPSTTGIYGLKPWIREIPKYQQHVSLPQHFKNHGYETFSGGKIYHGGNGRQVRPPCTPEFDHWGPGAGPGARPPKKLVPPTPTGNHPLVDWGVFDHDEKDKGDWKVADWAVQTLQGMPERESDQPFFLSVGFFLPHVPCHVTPKYWDMFPAETLILPRMQKDDRTDCSPLSWYLHWNLPEPRLSWLEHHDEQINLVRSYLGCIAFVDSQVQRVIDALAQSGEADNTIIVLWSDHGWHLGEKEITGKNTLWEPSTRVPLIFAGPGIEPGTTNQPAELLDIYPTLSDLAGLPAPEAVEGISLVPQLNDTSAARSRPAITDHNPGNFGIRDTRYRLIRYADGSEELYDLENDPEEFTNVIDRGEHASAANRLRKWVRQDPAPLAANSASRILEHREDGWYWENEKIDPDHPPMSIGATRKEDLPR